ncbi:hypothetical protein STCU_11808 [Strigomonas culicis]|uniref:Uncharacterized protein n=1 Tax=Strigomonas culicis TaxID=28005 RepID=S9UYX1_9TRYP|nr:hypothetical protein STCU_11808 [Strigomonas culicis]|eukprot:EPY15725.1 hypothetical protein STCU_11808 [Strigomonas culicis]
MCQYKLGDTRTRSLRSFGRVTPMFTERPPNAVRTAAGALPAAAATGGATALRGHRVQMAHRARARRHALRQCTSASSI